jgi:hypothetical protein
MSKKRNRLIDYAADVINEMGHSVTCNRFLISKCEYAGWKSNRDVPGKTPERTLFVQAGRKDSPLVCLENNMLSTPQIEAGKDESSKTHSFLKSLHKDIKSLQEKVSSAIDCF